MRLLVEIDEQTSDILDLGAGWHATYHKTEKRLVITMGRIAGFGPDTADLRKQLGDLAENGVAGTVAVLAHAMMEQMEASGPYTVMYEGAVGVAVWHHMVERSEAVRGR